MTYIDYLWSALRIGVILLCMGILSIIHSLFPFVFKDSTTKAMLLLNKYLHGRKSMDL